MSQAAGTPEAVGTPDAAKPDECFKIKLVIQATYPSPPTRIEHTLPLSSTVKDLTDYIYSETNYKPEIYTIKLRFSIEVPTDQPEKTLAECKFTSSNLNPLIIERAPAYKDAKPAVFELPQKHARVIEPMDISSRAGLQSSSNFHEGGGGGSVREHPGGVAAMMGREAMSMMSRAKSNTGYEGLANEGATCYLNSLLQTLYVQPTDDSVLTGSFMTPEFRAAVYEWSFETWCRGVFEEKLAEQQKKHKDDETSEHSDKSGKEKLSVEERYQAWKEKAEESSIPRQLQKLFLRLQMSDVRAETTQALTKSFGWERNDAFTQHDVQELCRVLLEALEAAYKGTEKANIVNELYQGEMKDYVRCLHCGHEGSRTDSFLDIPLGIKSFGEVNAVKSIEEALQKFIEAETLTGSNAYKCEHCHGNRDAIKGLKFTRFPYLLALQLKRFDFDFQYMRRQKLNHRVTFPEILDMNPYLDKTVTKGQSLINLDEHHDDAEDKGEDSTSSTSTTHTNTNTANTSDSTADSPSTPIAALAAKSGENAGDAGTKPAEGEATEAQSKEAKEKEMKEKIAAKAKARRQEQIEEALKNGPYVYELFSILIHRGSAMGGHYYCYIRSFRTGDWICFNDSFVSYMSPSEMEEAFGSARDANSQSGTNAYMLMYRQYDPIKNKVEISKDELSEDFKSMIEEENQRKKEKEEAKQLMRFKIHYNNEMKEIEMKKEEEIKALIVGAAKLFDLEAKLNANCLRVREFNVHLDVSQKVLPRDSTDTVDQRYYTGKNFVIETKEEAEVFVEYNPDHLNINCFLFDEATGQWSTKKNVSLDRESLVRDLKAKIAPYCGIAAEDLVITQEAYNEHNASVLDNDARALKADYRVYEGTKLWVEKRGATVAESARPRAFGEITRIKNAIEIFFNNPGEETHPHKVTVSKRISFEDLKNIIALKLSLDMNKFRVFRGPLQYKTELRNYDESLAEQGITSTHKVYVELGTPLRSGDVLLHFVFFDPNAEQQVTDFALLPLNTKLTVGEAKAEIVKAFHERQLDEKTKFPIADFDIGPAENLRLREINLNPINPRNIYMDHETVKTMSRGLVYTTVDIAIQKLDFPEPKTSKDTIIFFLQEFNNETYTLGKRFELDTNDKETLTSFRDRIAGATTISQIGLTSGGSWLGPNRLDIPHLKWNDPPECDENGNPVQMDTSRVKSLNIQDGDLVLFKDMTVVPMPLTEEEKNVIRDEDKKRRSTLLASSGRRLKATAARARENKLVIHQKDIELDDQ